jgi:hypothetical protein
MFYLFINIPFEMFGTLKFYEQFKVPVSLIQVPDVEHSVLRLRRNFQSYPFPPSCWWPLALSWNLSCCRRSGRSHHWLTFWNERLTFFTWKFTWSASNTHVLLNTSRSLILLILEFFKKRVIWKDKKESRLIKKIINRQLLLSSNVQQSQLKGTTNFPSSPKKKTVTIIKIIEIWKIV